MITPIMCCLQYDLEIRQAVNALNFTRLCVDEMLFIMKYLIISPCVMRTKLGVFFKEIRVFPYLPLFGSSQFHIPINAENIIHLII